MVIVENLGDFCPLFANTHSLAVILSKITSKNIDMKVFKSSNSTEVKIITTLTLIIFALIIITIFYGQTTEINIYLKTFIVLSITIGIIYFYSNSLKEIKLTDKFLILKKNVGQQIIDLHNIESINKIEFSNLTSTISSKGFFGFNGNLMDDSITLINNRKKIVRVSTLEKKYLISVDNPEDLIDNIENKKNYS